MKKNIFILTGMLILILCSQVFAASVGGDISRVINDMKMPDKINSSLQVLLIFTVISLAPSILVMVTSFTRIVVILSFLRQALSMPGMPPNQILIGLALFLTFFIMAPTWNRVNEVAIQPYVSGKINEKAAYEKGIKPIREFMIKQTRKKDLALFVHLAKLQKPKNVDEVPTYVVIPSFIISELKTAFEIGFLLFIPFLVIDIVVSSILMSMGMMMIPPMMFSLPFKVLLFVLVDGWYLLIRSVVMSFK